MSKIEKILNRDALFYWKRYEKCKDYIYKKNLVNETNTNWNFYIGNQWEGLETGGKDKPMVFNFIKRHIDHKVSSISQNNMTVRYSDLNGDGNTEIYEKLDGMYESWREKGNLNLADRQTMKEAAVTGDGWQYYGTDDVKDMQRLVTSAVLLGDESEQNVQRQPHITIEERLSIGTVKSIAKENGLSDEEISLIKADGDTSDLVGNKYEVYADTRTKDSKCTCLINLERVNGIIYTCRSTKGVIFEPMHPITAKNELGKSKSMTLYPLVRMMWEDYPNSARGVSEVKGMIPVQIEYNKTKVRESTIITQTAYPKLAVLSGVTNKDALNKVGGIIEFDRDDLSVSQMIQYVQPAQISSVPANFAENILSTIQEISGSGETTMGNINPNRVAASAYTEIRDQANLILGEKEERAIQFVEDRARLFIEMWSVYMPNGIDFTREEINDETGEIETVSVHISPDEIEQLKPDVRVDVAKTDAWSKEAEQSYIDTLFDKGQISLDEAVELYSDGGIAPKQKLRKMLAKRKRLKLTQPQQGDEMSEQEISDRVMAQWEAQDS